MFKFFNKDTKKQKKGKLIFLFTNGHTFELSEVDEESVIKIQNLISDSNGEGYIEQEASFSIKADSILLINYIN